MSNRRHFVSHGTSVTTSFGPDGYFGNAVNTVAKWQTLEPVPIDHAIWNRLYGYQKQGVEWMSRKEQMAASSEAAGKYASRGGMLLDDMGLGKTVQLIALCLRHPHEDPTLVVCPASIAQQWQDELLEYAGQLHGRSIRYIRKNGPQVIYALRKTGIPFLVATYEQLRAKRPEESPIHNCKFHRVILDECMSAILVKKKFNANAQNHVLINSYLI
jgi:SNF2 family DNA or RNA helicase